MNRKLHMDTMHKQEILFDETAKKKILLGMKKIGEIIADSYGPLGGMVAIEKALGAPQMKKSAFVLLQGLHIKDDLEDVGISLVKQTCNQLKNGSGSSTAALLLFFMCNKVMKHLAAGYKSVFIKKGVEKGLDYILKELDKMKVSFHMDDVPKIIEAFNYNHTIEANLIIDGFKKSDASGLINVEMGNALQSTLHITQGLRITSGYIHDKFASSEGADIVLDNPSVLIVNKKCQSAHELLPILQWAHKSKKQLVLIADDFEAEIVSTILVNHLNKIFHIIPIKMPSFGERKASYVQDIACLTGATIIDESIGLRIKDLQESWFGTADSFTISKGYTTIVSQNINKEQLEERLSMLDLDIKNAASAFEKKQLVEEKAQLQGGLITIRVGGSNEMDIQHKKNVFEEAVVVIKSVLEDGVVAGGGIALLHAAKNMLSIPVENKDEYLGIQLLKDALDNVCATVIKNAGYNENCIIEKLLEREHQIGFDVMKGSYSNFIETGIVDPISLIKTAIIAACASTSIFIMCDVAMSAAMNTDS